MTQVASTSSSPEQVGDFPAGPPGAAVAVAPGAGTWMRPRTSGSDPTIPRRLLGPIVAFSRAVNPWVLRLAGRPGVPIAVVRHRGRRSGQAYANPVIAFPTGGGFVISLP